MSGPGITNFPDGMIAAGRTKAAVVKGDHIPIGDSEDDNKVKVASVEAIYDLIAGTPPKTLDTLAKLAAAINDDPNFHSTLTTALAGKAPLASPALTGTPTAPTAAAGTNTTRLANTAFVTGAVAGVTASSIGLGSVDNTSDIDKPVSTAQAEAIGACRPKHPHPTITTVSTSITSARGMTYRVNAHGCTLTLPLVTTAGYVDGDEIGVVLGVTKLIELTIVSPSIIVRGTGQHPANTPFTLTGRGTCITFTKGSSGWMMSYPEYELSLKAPLASPALTGTPTAPTAAPGTNTNQLANCAFVTGALAGASGVPAGVICMWSGTIATVPTGWALCNGANGTPNLRNRFIVGAGTTYNPGDTGGLDSVTLDLTQIPAHTHAGTTAGGGAHTHIVGVPYWSGASGSATMINKRDAADDDPAFSATASVQPAPDHTHPFTTDSKGGGGSHENRPPYYALAYIMKL